MTAEALLHPALPMLLGACLLPLLPARWRAGAFLVFPLLALACVVLAPIGASLTLSVAGYDLQPLRVDALSRVFAFIFALIALVGGIYALHLRETGQQVCALAYAGGALGVACAGDYLTLFVFWELMAVSSTWLIWARRCPVADRAGMRYLLVHIAGGGLLLTGILLHVSASGSVAIGALPPSGDLAAVLMLLGVAVNAAIPPLHAWLADAYPKATITGAVFMSAFTTKSAVYVLIRVFPGWEVLIWVGVAMALYGVVYAVLANDIREILAYHIISQVGYMVAGAGIGTELALNGATAHAFCHILYKSLLFMGAGAVLQATGRSRLTELGGIAGRMKLTVFLYMIGAFSISGFPLFNGFISKAMVVDAAGAAHLDAAMLLLILASVGTFLHTGLKLPYFTWFGRQNGGPITVGKVPRNMLAAMAVGAFCCTLLGVAPGLLYAHLPYPVAFKPYTLYHLVEATQILIFTFIGFWLLRGKLAGEPKLALDTDWLYRMPAPLLRRVFVGGVGAVFDRCEELAGQLARASAGAMRDPMRWLTPWRRGGKPAAEHIPAMGTVMSLVLFGLLLFAVLVMG
jgi:multicomponent Na+:H+ antiporter subunit D